MRLAQRFNAGVSVRCGLSPGGTAEGTGLVPEFSRPFGTWRFGALFPALKRWAILTCPSGTRPPRCDVGFGKAIELTSDFARPVRARGLQGVASLCAGVLLLAGARFCASAAQIPVLRSESVRSSSGQFIIQAPGLGGPVGNASLAGRKGDLLQLEPGFVGVSCERIRQALLRELGPTGPWQGKIYVEVQMGRAAGQPVTITSERFLNGWQYRLQLPATVERERYTRAVVQVLLMELANRGSSGRLAEIPAWLSEGLTERLLAFNRLEIILPPPRDTVNGISFAATRATQRLNDPVAHARQQLNGQTPLTFDQLSWQATDQLSGDAAQIYRASAEMFLGELLRFRDGPTCLAAMLARLPALLQLATGVPGCFPCAFRTDARCREMVGAVLHAISRQGAGADAVASRRPGMI